MKEERPLPEAGHCNTTYKSRHQLPPRKERQEKTRTEAATGMKRRNRTNLRLDEDTMTKITTLERTKAQRTGRDLPPTGFKRRRQTPITSHHKHKTASKMSNKTKKKRKQEQDKMTRINCGKDRRTTHRLDQPPRPYDWVQTPTTNAITSHHKKKTT